MRFQRPAQQGETGFALLLLVFSVTAFWQSYEISGFSGLSTPGVFPMLASATMVVAAAFILVQSIQRKTTHGGDHLPESDQGFFQSILPPRLLIMVVLITAYVVAMPAFGFLVASGAFLFLSFSYLWQKSVLVSLVLTLVSLVSVYLVFRKLFQVVLPKGTLLQGWF